jgi:hypothetical protein
MIAQNPPIDRTSLMGGSDLVEKIVDTLESNGDLDQDEVNRLVLLTLVDLVGGRRDARICRQEIGKANERIDKLEKNNILMLAHKHPKAAFVVVATGILFVVSVIAHLELWGWIADIIKELTGVPLP